LARFGLIPSKAKEDKISRNTYNARSETAAEKSSPPTAWRHRTVDVEAGFAKPALRAVHGQSVKAWGLPRLGDTPAEQFAALHNCMG
jgi:putative SOS response-associated peptidase YedK